MPALVVTGAVRVAAADNSPAGDGLPDVSNPGALAGAPQFRASSSPVLMAENDASSLAHSSSPVLRTDETQADPKPSAPAALSPNAMVNLVNLLVEQKVVTREAGDKLIRQAQQEADLAHAQAASTAAAADHALTAQAAQPAAAPAPTPAEPADDDVHVAYVPENVKQQMAAEIKNDVMKQAKDEHWGTQDTQPEWIKRFRINGDIRLRYEGDRFPEGNAVGNFTNFNSINTGPGFNINQASPGYVTPPQYDVDQNRNRFRLRLRIGAEIALGQGFTAGVRIATGSDDNPVTENQTLGSANGAQGGNFSKYQVWLDRAFLRYEMGRPDKNFSISAGRFDNPFFHTPMLFADDLAFDGVVAEGKYQVVDGVTPFFTAGGFPVFNTDFNFSTNQSQKFASEDKYLFAAQGGTDWKINPDFTAKVAVAYYYFQNIQGKVSDPIPVANANEVGNTDDSRPSFQQNGNTMIALRNYTDPAPGTTAENEYFGLATPFHELAFTSQLDFSRFDPFHISLQGEVVDNLAFDRDAIVNGGPASFQGPQNNTRDSSAESFDGGDLGYLVRMTVGHATLEKLGDWNVNLSYRYVESDSTVDAFTDSDFGGDLAGTNLQGYTVGGNLALTSRVFASLRWMSADAIAGPSYRNDLIQFDVNAKF